MEVLLILITHPSTIKAIISNQRHDFFGHIIKLTSRIFSGHEALVEHHSDSILISRSDNSLDGLLLTSDSLERVV